jgi:hypothetical protein
MPDPKYHKGQWWVCKGPYPGPYVVAHTHEDEDGPRVCLMDTGGDRWEDPVAVENTMDITAAEWKQITVNQADNFRQVTKPMEIRKFNNVEET